MIRFLKENRFMTWIEFSEINQYFMYQFLHWRNNRSHDQHKDQDVDTKE